MEQIAIYLAGNIQKGHEKESQIFWTQADKDHLSAGLSPINISFLNPALRADDLSDQLSVFGRDMTQVYCCDAVFVDARERRGLGVGAEMMWAKMHDIPIITYAPKNSHYRKEEVHLLGQTVNDWVHPFVECLSDEIVEDLDQAIVWLKRFCSGELTDIKGYTFIKEAMQHYKEVRFMSDLPMKDLADNNAVLQSKINGIAELV